MEDTSTTNLDIGSIELKQYLDILLKRRYLFVLAFIVPVVVGSIFVISQRSIYQIGRASCRERV